MSDLSINAAALYPFGAPEQLFVWAVVLMSLRLAGMFILTPAIQAMNLPGSVRILLVLSLSCALVIGLPLPASAAVGALQGHPGLMIQACLTEMALGATLGLGMLSAFAAVSLAAGVLDIQLGFGLAQVVDPVTRRHVPILTMTFNLFAVLMFFLIDGHHALMRAVAYSLERFPLGQPWQIQDSAMYLMKQFSGLYGLGFALCAPVVMCVLLTELALGVISRNLPQMNIFMVGMPIKIVVGLAALAWWLVGMSGAMNRIFAFIFQTWGTVFDVLEPMKVVR